MSKVVKGIGKVGKGIGKGFASFFRGKAGDLPEAVAARAAQAAQTAQGQTTEQRDQARNEIQPVLDYLQSQGMAADQAQIIQQGIAQLSQEDLAQAYEGLSSFAEDVQSGLLNPGDISTLGGLVATSIQKQYQTGQAFDFGSMMSDITDQMQEKMPDFMNTANQAGEVANQITEQTGALGKLDANKFNERFDPALQRLNEQYKEDSRTLSEQMDARGIQEQGSFAGQSLDNEGRYINNPRITSESSPENHARLLLAQQHDKDLTSAALQAQAQAEGQQVSELSAAQRTPGALGEAIQTQASPFAALSNQTQAEGNTNLALQSSRANDTKMLTDSAQGAQAKNIVGASGAAEAQQTILNTDIARRDQTLNPAIAEKAVSQTDRLANAAGVSSGTTGAFASLSGANNKTNQDYQKMAAGGALAGLAAFSDRRLKSNIIRIGTHVLGIGIYAYNIFGKRMMGVMADEVLTVRPEAVFISNDGYYLVNYAML